MPRLQIGPDNKSFEVNPGETILGASLRGGINHIHACGGKARCSTCRVQILEGLANCSPCTEAEAAMASRLHFAPEIRLACQTRVNGDVNLRRLALDDRDGELHEAIAGKGTGSIGEEKRIAILFSDIRGFTSFSERLPPYDVIHVLNRYFAEMAKPITENHGCIDNYIGDGIMALFGMQQPKDVTLDAIKAGLGMLRASTTCGRTS